MADKCQLLLIRLMILCSFLTGTCEAEETNVFISSGEDVHLPCNNALSDCTSTTWIYSRHLETVELVAGGITKKDTNIHERLSLGSGCSLNIEKVTKEDYGIYSCQRYVNKQQRATDACVHVLHVYSLSSPSDIRPGKSLTLYCQLASYKITCDALVRFEGFQLMWVNQAGLNLMTDSRYQILFSSSLCNISLTTTLLNEDHNKDWKCQLTLRNQLRTSASFTVEYSDQDVTTPVLPIQTPNSDDPLTRNTPESPTQDLSTFHLVIMIIVKIAVFAAPTVILLQIICARRAGN